MFATRAFTVAVAAALLLIGQVQAVDTVPRAALIATNAGMAIFILRVLRVQSNYLLLHRSRCLQPSQQRRSQGWVQLQVLFWPL